MKQNKETLKAYFETGDKPTQQQYTDLIDSYVDNKQPIGEANRRFVIDAQGEVNLASEQQVLEYTLSPISGTNTVDLLKDGVSVSQIDLTSFIDSPILKTTKTFAIGDLSTASVYELIPAQGENTLLSIHKIIFDVNITSAYVGTTTDNVFGTDIDGEPFTGTSSFMDINIVDRKIKIFNTGGSESSTTAFNKPLTIKPKVTGTGGSLTAKITVLYSVIEA